MGKWLVLCPKTIVVSFSTMETQGVALNQTLNLNSRTPGTTATG